jgi:hypothetical protein
MKEVIMKWNKILPVLFIVAILSIGCSTPVYVQKDDAVNLDGYKTYTWVDTRASENDNTARASAFADISVRNAVNAELRKKGWTEVTDNADVLVSYDVLVERSVEQKSDPVYTQPFSRMYYNPYTKRWSSIYYPSQFIGYQTYEVPVKEGTITISLIDAKSDRSVWQGWTTEDMNYSRFTEDEVSRAVRNIFKKF